MNPVRITEARDELDLVAGLLAAAPLNEATAEDIAEMRKRLRHASKRIKEMTR